MVIVEVAAFVVIVGLNRKGCTRDQEGQSGQEELRSVIFVFHRNSIVLGSLT